MRQKSEKWLNIEKKDEAVIRQPPLLFCPPIPHFSPHFYHFGNFSMSRDVVHDIFAVFYHKIIRI